MTIEDRLAFETVCPAQGGFERRQRPGLYLKYRHGGDSDGKSAESFGIFEGKLLFMFFEDTQKVSLAPRSMWVFPNDVLLPSWQRFWVKAT
ncbi:MAG: hypothetical protein ACLRXC_12765 [[Clostridium] leptum]